LGRDGTAFEMMGILKCPEGRSGWPSHENVSTKANYFGQLFSAE